MPATDLIWTKVLEPDELPEGRVKPVTCAHTTLCLTHFKGKFGALDNRCPHQGGPLGEGSIEGGRYLRRLRARATSYPHGFGRDGRDDG